MPRLCLVLLCSVLFAADAAAFEGRYLRSGPDFRQTAVIARTGDNVYSVRLKSGVNRKSPLKKRKCL